jgi:hypothetical protein
MRPLFECNVCYDSTYHVIHCFNDCSFKVCRDCFKKLLELDDGKIYYTCPMCRVSNIYGESKRFTKFIDKGLDLLKIIIKLYKNNYIQNKTNEQWTAYTLATIDDDMLQHIHRIDSNRAPQVL